MNNNKIDELKNEYENLHADKAFRERIEKTMKKEINRKKNIKRIASAAACMAVFTVGLNVSPSFAYAMSSIPVVNSVVKVLTLNKYEVKTDNYQAEIVTPKVEGLLDKDLENKLNEEFKNNADAVKAAFEQSVNELKAEYGEDDFHEGVEFNYEVKTDNDNILAIDVYTYSVAGSSSTVHDFYNINKKTGEFITFKSLFKEGTDYITPISDYIKKECKRMNEEEGGMFFLAEDGEIDGFDKISENQKFYINNDGKIVICFDKYEIAAGAQGSPEFVLPDEVVNDILK